MFSDPWLAALCALFLWWFSTGAILLLVRTCDGAGARLACLATLPFPVWGGWVYWSTLPRADVGGAYLGFLAALAIWGWIELAFLTGVICGPVRRPCPDHLPEWERFIRAWGTVAYHEILLLAVLLAMAFAGWTAENLAGLWTFAVLYFARISAKLNLYLGVPCINVEFIPRALSHLPSHFRIRRLNWLFPVSITALSFALACWLERLWSAATPGDSIAFALLAALTALALAEHWLLVLPLPDARLWRWMLPEPQHTIRHAPEERHGS